MAKGPLTFKRQDLMRALKAAKDAGFDVAKVEIDRDGKIVVIMGQPDAPEPSGEIVL